MLEKCWEPAERSPCGPSQHRSGWSPHGFAYSSVGDCHWSPMFIQAFANSVLNPFASRFLAWLYWHHSVQDDFSVSSIPKMCNPTSHLRRSSWDFCWWLRNGPLWTISQQQLTMMVDTFHLLMIHLVGGNGYGTSPVFFYSSFRHYDSLKSRQEWWPHGVENSTRPEMKPGQMLRLNRRCKNSYSANCFW